VELLDLSSPEGSSRAACHFKKDNSFGGDDKNCQVLKKSRAMDDKLGTGMAEKWRIQKPAIKAHISQEILKLFSK
jgi:hypothetical protein